MAVDALSAPLQEGAVLFRRHRAALRPIQSVHCANPRAIDGMRQLGPPRKRGHREAPASTLAAGGAIEGPGRIIRRHLPMTTGALSCLS